MKKNLLKLMLLFVFLISASYSASAQIFVNVRPPVPVIVRPPQPSRDHIWVNEEWEPNGKEYRYTGGHWVNPPHKGDRFREGHWNNRHGGHSWTPGRWKGRK
jgi:hypothetical protein